MERAGPPFAQQQTMRSSAAVFGRPNRPSITGRSRNRSQCQRRDPPRRQSSNTEQEQPTPPPIPSPPPPAVESTPEPTSTPEAFQLQQPVLPAIFRGCWQGEVEFLDSIERLPGAAKIGAWTPKTYRLCYERYGSGPFQLTFTEAGIERNSKITHAQGAMELLSTDGRTYATMRALLSIFDGSIATAIIFGFHLRGRRNHASAM